LPAPSKTLTGVSDPFTNGPGCGRHRAVFLRRSRTLHVWNRACWGLRSWDKDENNTPGTAPSVTSVTVHKKTERPGSRGVLLPADRTSRSSWGIDDCGRA